MTKDELKKIILEIAQYKEKNNGRYLLSHFGADLRKKGFDHRSYGFLKLAHFFELLHPFVEIYRDTTKTPPVVFFRINESEEIPENVDKILKESYKSNPDFESFLFEEQSKVSELSTLFSFISAIIALFSLLFAVYVLFFSDSSKYFSADIKTKIKKTILNGADITVVKHLYSSKELYTVGIFDKIFNLHQNENKYPENTSLNVILKDIKSEYYLTKGDSGLLTRLDAIIIENDQLDPFENLDPNQKFMFQNVRQKLDSNYTIIQQDFNRIADDLKNKNVLLDKYLDKSDQSYWISIIALIFSVVVSVFQVIQSNSSNKRISEIHAKFISSQILGEEI